MSTFPCGPPVSILLKIPGFSDGLTSDANCFNKGEIKAKSPTSDQQKTPDQPTDLMMEISEWNEIIRFCLTLLTRAVQLDELTIPQFQVGCWRCRWTS